MARLDRAISRGKVLIEMSRSSRAITVCEVSGATPIRVSRCNIAHDAGAREVLGFLNGRRT
jgi:hypothetical protein